MFVQPQTQEAPFKGISAQKMLPIRANSITLPPAQPTGRSGYVQEEMGLADDSMSRLQAVEPLPPQDLAGLDGFD